MDDSLLLRVRNRTGPALERQVQLCRDCVEVVLEGAQDGISPEPWLRDLERTDGVEDAAADLGRTLSSPSEGPMTAGGSDT